LKRILSGFLTGAVFTLASPAQAAVVDFDDVTAGLLMTGFAAKRGGLAGLAR